jgi:CBS domain-containing protein
MAIKGGKMSEKVNEKSDEQVRSKIKNFCKTQFGVLDSNFMCQSVSVLNPNKPITVTSDTTLANVIKRLQECKIGGVLVVDHKGVLKGIFTERDCIQKVLGKGIDLEATTVESYMTHDPVAQPPDITTAYALNLMSHGGFRHLPLVDQDHVPIGIISVKDVLDFIVGTFFNDLMDFEESAI